MTHKNVYDIFEALFPMYASGTELWFPNGLHSVRLRLINKREFIFTYHTDKDWCFETIDSHLEKMRIRKGE